MKKSWLLALAIAAGAAAWLASGALLPGDNGTGAQPAAASSPAAPPAVRVAWFEAGPMTEVLNASGRTRAQRTVQVRAEIGGRVEAIEFREGESARAGQVLMRLATEDREARFVEARALVAHREAELDAAERLQERGLGSQTDLAAARAALDAARSQAVLAEINVQRLEVAAPFAGVLDESHVEVGAMVDRGDPLVTLVDLDPLRVRANVAERNLGRVRLGMRAQVAFVGGIEVEGEVTFVGARADETTRTFPIELEVANLNASIIEQASARIRLPLEERTAQLLPASLLGLSDEGVLGVKALDENDVVVFQQVFILGDGEGGVWVQGLPERVRLITVGQDFVRPGQTVRPVEHAGPASGADLAQ